MKKGQVNVGYAPKKVAFLNTEKLVGSADRYSTIDYKAIVAYAAKAAAVPESSIDMAMEALFDAMNYFVLNGHSVQIPNLGTFSLSVRAKTASNESEFTADFRQNLRGVKINFLPDSDLKAMLANTSISTSLADTTGYVSDGVVAVTAKSFLNGMQKVAMNNGGAYPVAVISAIRFDGTRLTADYLGTTPLTIVLVDVDGTEHSVMLGGSYLTMNYDNLTANIKKLLAQYPNAKYLKSLVLKDADNNTIVEQAFAAVGADPIISAVSVNSNPIAAGGTVGYVAGQSNRIVIYGDNFDVASEIKIGTTVITPSSLSKNQIICSFTPAATGNYPVSVKSETSVASIYNMSFGAAGGTVITGVIANGDALLNGGTTNITAGSNYSIQVQGAGLDELTTSNFVLPSGTTIVIASQSATMIQATINNAQAGDFKVRVDGVDLFSAGLVVVNPGVTVTGYKLSAQGAVQSLSTAVNADASDGSFSIILVGNDIDDLTNANFSGSGLNNLDYTPVSGTLTGVCGSTGVKALRIAVDDTTIATININYVGSSDDGQN